MPQRRIDPAEQARFEAILRETQGFQSILNALLSNRLVSRRQQEGDERFFAQRDAEAEAARNDTLATQFGIPPGTPPKEVARIITERMKEQQSLEAQKAATEQQAALMGRFGGFAGDIAESQLDEDPQVRARRRAALGTASVDPVAEAARVAVSQEAPVDPTLATAASGGTVPRGAPPLPGISGPQQRAIDLQQKVDEFSALTGPTVDRSRRTAEATSPIETEQSIAIARGSRETPPEIFAGAEARAAGTAAGTPEVPVEPTQQERIAAGFFERAKAADQQLRSFLQEAEFTTFPGIEPRLAVNPLSSFGRNFAIQKAEFTRVVLRLESGAAITKDEKTDLLGTLPESGDTTENLAQKDAIRRRIIQGIGMRAGMALREPVQRAPSSGETSTGVQFEIEVLPPSGGR